LLHASASLNALSSGFADFVPQVHRFFLPVRKRNTAAILLSSLRIGRKNSVCVNGRAVFLLLRSGSLCRKATKTVKITGLQKEPKSVILLCTNKQTVALFSLALDGKGLFLPHRAPTIEAFSFSIRHRFPVWRAGPTRSCLCFRYVPHATD
jgi:hypothetical protein